MTFRSLNRLSGTSLALAALVLAAACSGKRPPALATATPGETDKAARDRAGRIPEGAPMEGSDLRPIEGEGTSGSDITGGAYRGEGGPLVDIHFDYDSAALSDEARAVLEKHALWLQGQRDSSVLIEGHCDERGTVEYNLALGEQRARATREYLLSLGVDPGRLRVVSYGKERPLDAGGDDAARAKNRRAHFTVAR